MVAKVWAWLHGADWRTWVGHGVIGFLLTAGVGWQFTFGAFLYRELSDLINWWADKREAWHGPLPYPTVSNDFKRPLTDALKDGFFDIWSPLAGAAIALILFG